MVGWRSTRATAWKGWRTVLIGRCIAPIRCRLQLRYWSWRCDRARGYWGARRIALELAKKGSSQRLRSRRSTAAWFAPPSSTPPPGAGDARPGRGGSEVQPWSCGSSMPSQSPIPDLSYPRAGVHPRIRCRHPWRACRLFVQLLRDRHARSQDPDNPGIPCSSCRLGGG